MKMWFETHSTSIDNERGVASGHLDVPLSEVGRQQAVELRSRCVERNLQMIYTSDLARSVDTAEIAFGHSTLCRVSDRRLREWNYGSLSGCSVHQVDAARAEYINQRFPGGESLQDVVGRVESFLNSLIRREGPVLVIAHRAPWYAIEYLLRGRDLLHVVTFPWKWQPGWEYDL